jgi:ATP-binding cassette, subfamily B, bacterial HlyB/CyaB
MTELPAVRYPWVGQARDTDCGAACLAMVARFHGLPVGAEEVGARMNLGPRGATIGEVVRAAAGLRLAAQAVKVSDGQWQTVPTPSITHLSWGHYVVLYRLDASGVVLGDPAAGVVTVSWRSFREQASGYVVLTCPATSSS